MSHYDGLPVEFIAAAISTLGTQLLDDGDGFQTYHVMNPYDDGIGLDEYVDWLVEAGYGIQRIADYGEWLQRFDQTLRALPERQRQYSLLPLLHNYQKPDDADQRIDGTDRPVPRRGAGGENRPRQRHSACLGVDHRQVRHRPAVARTAVEVSKLMAQPPQGWAISLLWNYC